MSALPKPVLRGHLSRSIVKNIAGAFAFSVLNAGLFYFLYMLPKKRAYAEFHRTYDQEEHYKLLAKYGYLDSALKKKH